MSCSGLGGCATPLLRARARVRPSTPSGAPSCPTPAVLASAPGPAGGGGRPNAQPAPLALALLSCWVVTPCRAPKRTGLPLITYGGARSWRCLARNFHLPPSSAIFSPKGCTMRGRGAPSPHAPSFPTPSSASFDGSAKPLQPSARLLHRRRRKLVRKEINSPVTTFTRAARAHARGHTHTLTHSHGLRFGL